MKNAKYLLLIVFAIVAVSTGATAQVTPSAGSDSTKAPSAAALRQQSQQPQSSLNRAVGRTTKKTNWSKIKTLFE